MDTEKTAGLAGQVPEREADWNAQESARRLATLLANLPGMAYRCSSDPDWTMEFVSEGCEELTGYSTHDLIGNRTLSYASLIHPEDRESVWEEVQSAVRLGIPFQLTYRIRTAGGGEKWVWEQGRGIFSGATLEAIEGFITDITDRKNVESQLKNHRERFERILHNTDAGYFRVGLDGCFEEVNPAWLRMYGIARKEDIIGQPLSVVQTPPDLAKAEQIAASVMEGRPVRSGEFSRLRGDGTVGHHRFSANPVYTDGRISAIEGFLIDISDQRVSDEQRQESENRYRALFDSMQEGVAVHRLIGPPASPENYRLIDVNRRYEEIVGQKRDEVANRLANEVYGTQEPPYLKEFASVVETGKPFRFETYFAPMDKYFVISVVGMGDRLFATIFFDVTEQRRTEQHYKLISENSADVIWLWDLTAVNCRYVSPSVQQLRGISVEEAMGQSMEQALPPDTYLRVREGLEQRRRALESGDEGARVQTDRIDFLRRDGTSIATETVTTLLSDESGRLTGIIGVTRDIRERLKLEQQFLQAQKLESLGRLAGGVAHDFNNLLTIIQGYADLLIKGFDATDPRSESVNEIRLAAERAAGLTKQLLAFSRKQVIAPKKLDLNATIRESERMLKRLIGEDVALTTRLETSLTAVLADPEHVHQVIMNLAVNARDAMPNGGRLEICTQNVEFPSRGSAPLQSPHKPGQYVRLTVADTGVGISEDIRPHIFEPFFTTKERDKGTGLGLSTVYGIVQQVGGWIEVTSEQGAGTSFDLYFPRL